MLRAINCTKIKDKISIKSMLDKFQLLSVSQLAAKIKLIEVWKSINKEDYPIRLDAYKLQQAEQSHDLEFNLIEFLQIHAD